MISPSSIVITLSADFAILISWVIKINVWLYFFAQYFNNSNTSFEFFESRFPVGSSAKIIDSLFAKALPIETLCCCPHDNCDG